jgi:hypothetical protein
MKLLAKYPFFVFATAPNFFVDRVKAPLMIIQGYMDWVAMQQREEFFNSLIFWIGSSPGSTTSRKKHSVL